MVFGVTSFFFWPRSRKKKTKGLKAPIQLRTRSKASRCASYRESNSKPSSFVCFPVRNLVQGARAICMLSDPNAQLEDTVLLYALTSSSKTFNRKRIGIAVDAVGTMDALVFVSTVDQFSKDVGTSKILSLSLQLSLRELWFAHEEILPWPTSRHSFELTSIHVADTRDNREHVTDSAIGILEMTQCLRCKEQDTQKFCQNRQYAETLVDFVVHAVRTASDNLRGVCATTRPLEPWQ
jgi:hypothetical protein